MTRRARPATSKTTNTAGRGISANCSTTSPRRHAGRRVDGHRARRGRRPVGGGGRPDAPARARRAARARRGDHDDARAGAAGHASGRRQAPGRAGPRRPGGRPAAAAARCATRSGPSGWTMPPRRWLAWPRSGTGAWHGSSGSPSPCRPKPEPIFNTDKENAMTDHRTGTREEWLAARLELLDAEKELTRRGDRAGAAAPGAAVGSDREGVPLRDRSREPRRSPTSSKGARSCSSTTSCSGPTSRPGVRPARRSPTASPARSCTWPITTSRSRRCRARRWQSCRTTSGGWAGAFRGRPRSRATSTTTFTHRTPSRNGSRAPSSTTFAPPTSGPPSRAPG